MGYFSSTFVVDFVAILYCLIETLFFPEYQQYALSKEDYQYMNKDGTINGVKIEDDESNGKMDTSEDNLEQGNNLSSQK